MLSSLSDKKLTQVRRDRIGFIFQQFNLLPTLTAAENIRLPMDIAGRKVDRAWFDRVVQTLGLQDRLKHRPTEMSGGQIQRVACARAHRLPAGGDLRRRAHRQPGLARQRRGARLPAAVRYAISARP